MPHFVHCTYCNERFDRDKIDAIQVSARRYAHATCALKAGNAEEQALAEKTLADQAQQIADLTALESYIIKLLKIDYINARVRAQINKLHDENKYTYRGILKSLKYFYEVKAQSEEKANGGIGIVPYIYDEANNYYKKIWMAQQSNVAKPIEQYVSPQTQVIIIKPPVPPKRSQKKLFSFLDDEEET